MELSNNKETEMNYFEWQEQHPDIKHDGELFILRLSHDNSSNLAARLEVGDDYSVFVCCYTLDCIEREDWDLCMRIKEADTSK